MTCERAKTRIVVLGLGNELISDDGVGVHAIRRLREMLPGDVPCVAIGTAALKAEAFCAQAEVVIAIDAVQAQGRPGSVYVLDLVDAALPAAESLHNLSLAGLIALMPLGARPRGIVVGVEPARVEYGLALSEPVEAALPYVIRAVRDIVSAGGRIPPALAASGRSVGDLAVIEENS